MYKDNADTITGNCDSMIFLGGKGKGTLKEIEEMLGKALRSMDELSVMNDSKCVLQLRGVRPFLLDKYDITKHPNYKYLSDYDPRNAFNIEKFLFTKLKPKPDEVYNVYHVDLSHTETSQ